MDRKIASADLVLVVCTETYCARVAQLWHEEPTDRINSTLWQLQRTGLSRQGAVSSSRLVDADLHLDLVEFIAAGELAVSPRRDEAGRRAIDRESGNENCRLRGDTGALQSGKYTGGNRPMYKLQEVRMKEIHLNCIEITDVVVPIYLGRRRSLTPGSGSLKCPGWVFRCYQAVI